MTLNISKTQNAPDFMPVSATPWYRRILTHPVFRFFSSVRLAVFVLTSLMVVLATGTIIESLHGTDAARILVYNTFWFEALLILLGINVASAALSRIPWKKKHTGFVITHTGILLILLGSFLTRAFMVDGSMAIAEGSTESQITLAQPMLYIYSEADDESRLFQLKKHAFAWHGEESFYREGDTEFLLRGFYPKARMSEAVVPGSEGDPAGLKVRLKNSFLDQTLWLVENDVERGAMTVGPARFRFTDTPLRDFPGVSPETPYLEFQFEKENIPVSVPTGLKFPTELPVSGTPYRVRLQAVYEKAMVKGRELVEDPAAESNPAVRFTLLGPDGFEERHTVFANYPDFPSVHGMKPSKAGVKVLYRLPGGGSRGETHELRFLRQDGKLLAQAQDGLRVTTHEPKTGKAVSTGWMDLTFTVEEYFPQARIERRFQPAPNTSENPQETGALQVEMRSPKGGRVFWLRQGTSEEIESAGTKRHFLFGDKRVPAGFKLSLKDFRIQHNPGTENPASFESDVVLKDDLRGVVREATISMNNPLIYQGYRIYQSGYDQQEGQPDVSVYSIGKDAGAPVNYAGAIVMVAGVLTMFYTRKFSSTAGRSL